MLAHALRANMQRLSRSLPIDNLSLSRSLSLVIRQQARVIVVYF